MEISDLRKRLKQTIEAAKRAAAARRERHDAAEREGRGVIEKVATPVFKMVATALRAEGHLFQVSTPAASVRLASERARDDFIELALDTERDPVALVGRVSRTWGRRVLEAESIVSEAAGFAALTDEAVLAFLLKELQPFVER